MTQAAVGAQGGTASGARAAPTVPIHSADAPRPSAALAPKDATHYMRSGSLQLTELPPLSLYVHLPWCLRKCPYCDFNSHASTVDAALERRYVDALFADLDASLPLVWGRSVQTVFLGGGTPSLFSPDAIAELVSGLRARLRLTGACEITLEANPGTFEIDRFKAYRAAGITRLSVGVQSFNDRHLRALGRVHDRAQALAALAEAQACFNTFNLDLMYALPGQTLDEFEQDLSTALAIAPPHLSIYQLSIEPNTVFAKHPPQGELALPEDDLAYTMLDRLIERTEATGLARYEVSAFARDGHRCGHNLNYWTFGDYLGIGAGAHSKLSFAHRVVRQVRLREPGLYMDNALRGQALAQDDDVARSELPFEFMLNALRLKDGFELARFTERTGLPLTAIQRAMTEAEARGLLARDLQRAWPTPRGFDFLSDLQALFLPG